MKEKKKKVFHSFKFKSALLRSKKKTPPTDYKNIQGAFKFSVKKKQTLTKTVGPLKKKKRSQINLINSLMKHSRIFSECQTFFLNYFTLPNFHYTAFSWKKKSQYYLNHNFLLYHHFLVFFFKFKTFFHNYLHKC